jgi:phage terminase small subunit
MAERSRRTGISQDRVIRELARLAFVNPDDVINLNRATVKEDATEDDLAAIASVKVKTSSSDSGEMVEREVKLNDKLKALELLGKHLGMFKDKLDINANVNSTAKLDSILEQLNESEGNE